MVSFLFQIGLLAAYVIGAGVNLWEIYQTDEFDISKKKLYYIARALSVAGFIIFGLILTIWGIYVPAIAEFIVSAVLLGSKSCKSSSLNV